MDLALPLNEMTVAEKLRAIEILWDDLCAKPRGHSFSPLARRGFGSPAEASRARAEPSFCR